MSVVVIGDDLEELSTIKMKVLLPFIFHGCITTFFQWLSGLL